MAYNLKLKGKDEWGRNTYEDTDSKKKFAEVDGKMHYVTEQGEPLSPVHQKFEIEKPKVRIGIGHSGFRPYIIDGKEVEKIYIIKDGKETFSTSQGWFEDRGEGRYSSKDIEEIHLDSKPKRKIKVDLNSKESFYVKSPEQRYTYQRNRVDLYLTEKDAEVLEVDKKVFDFETADMKRYEDHFKIKVGDKIITERGNYVSEPTTFGLEVDKVHKDLNDNSVSKYDLEKIMKKYKLTKREKEIKD